jgi:hypothetical protein
VDAIRCPSCKRWLALPGEALGQAAQCPGCRSVFTPQSDSIGSDDGLREERFRGGKSGAGEDVAIRQQPLGVPRTYLRRNHPAAQPAIGRADKLVLCVGFLIGAGGQAAIGIASQISLESL